MLSPSSLFLLEMVAYLLGARLAMKCLSGDVRAVVFAALNLAAFYLIFFCDKDGRYLMTFAVYLVAVVLQYLMLCLFAKKESGIFWLAFFTPIAFLIAVRYILPPLGLQGLVPFGPYFVGISYLAFRSSYLVLEVRNQVVARPSFADYIGFCFFLPTIPVGPINAYSNHIKAFGKNAPSLSVGRSALRILLGLIKFKFLGSVCFQLTYTNLLLDDHYHHWIDLPVAVIFYYLFLYCNFSGFCDMAIGAAGLIGIPVAENFDNPFLARNPKDFWNRWHITLSHYMRDVVFSPFSKFMARLMGPANVNHAVTLPIIVVFLLVGIWHGVGWNYVAFGAFHALGVVATHYYTIALKKWCGREGFKAYNANPWIHAIAVILTFSYVAIGLFFFANTFQEMKQIFSVMR